MPSSSSSGLYLTERLSSVHESPCNSLGSQSSVLGQRNQSLQTRLDQIWISKDLDRWFVSASLFDVSLSRFISGSIRQAPRGSLKRVLACIEVSSYCCCAFLGGPLDLVGFRVRGKSMRREKNNEGDAKKLILSTGEEISSTPRI